MVRKLLLTFAGVVIFGFLLSLLLVEVPGSSPAKETRVRLHNIRGAIGAYWHERHQLPAGLLTIKDSCGGVELKDGWGHKIKYRIRGNSVIVTSHGEDGKPGGSGEAADIIVRFCLKKASSREGESREKRQ